MRTQLFIYDYEIELNEEVMFFLSKQFEEITNPTVIINDWSKTISIPMTEHNNKVFGYIYKPERVIIGDQSDQEAYKQMGIYFDPTKKLDFTLIYNNCELMQGYAKMNNISQTEYDGKYNITLYGQLGKLFQELKKITFDQSTEDTDYLINGADYVNEKINRALVKSSWTSSGQTTNTLYTRDNPNYHVTDIIGFAPNNSFSNDFNYDTYQETASTSNTFKDELGDSFTAATGVKPETAIPDGVMPREIGEYRSYQQLPFIYWNKLFKIFRAKAEELTGYTFQLDSSWFNVDNPYWYKLVYMLRTFPFAAKNGQLYNNLYGFRFNDQGTAVEASLSWSAPSGNTKDSECWQEEKLGQKFLAVEGSSTEVIDICDYASPVSHWELKDNSITTFKIPVRFYIIDWGAVEANNPYLVDGNSLIVEVIATGASGYTQTQKFIVQKSTSTIQEPDATQVIKDTKLLPNLWSNFEAYFACDPYDFGESVSFSFKAYWKTTTYPSTYWQAGELVQHRFQFVYFPDQSVQTNTMINTFKSNSHFVLNDLWSNEYNLFNEILKYCKIYRIGIFTDDVNKQLIFKRLNTYFSEYNIEDYPDWTDKIDRSKEIEITPITFENKYVMFNYKDIDSKLATQYKERYGVNYGEYRLVTDYNFNEETTNLFDGITPSITVTDNVLSYKNLRTNHKIVYSFPNELYVYNKDKSNNEVNLFGAYFFHRGLLNFSTEAALNLLAVHISDDTNFQLANNTYFYSRKAGNRTSVDTYPWLDIVYGSNMCVFNIPKENFTYNDNYSGKNSIYSNFWQNYIDERYNIQNKIVSCYLRLTPKDWMDFTFNKFIKINNILYMVNLISDYNIETPESTLVELITVSDITGYTN